MLLLQWLTARAGPQLRVSLFVSKVRVVSKRLNYRCLMGLVHASRRTGPTNRSGGPAPTPEMPRSVSGPLARVDGMRYRRDGGRMLGRLW